MTLDYEKVRFDIGTQQLDTLKREIALLLNSDLADPAPDGMFPIAFNERGHDG